MYSYDIYYLKLLYILQNGWCVYLTVTFFFFKATYSETKQGMEIEKIRFPKENKYERIFWYEHMVENDCNPTQSLQLLQRRLFEGCFLKLWLLYDWVCCG